MRRNTEAQRRASAKWEAEKAERRTIKYRKGTINRIKAAAITSGKSINGFCVDAIMAALNHAEEAD